MVELCCPHELPLLNGVHCGWNPTIHLLYVDGAWLLAYDDCTLHHDVVEVLSGASTTLNACLTSGHDMQPSLTAKYL
jgi:hypothetical protein